MTSRLAVLTLAAFTGITMTATAQLPPDWRADLLATRASAWHSFFGDPDKLAAMLPDDFIGIGNDGWPWTDRATTLARSRETTQAGVRVAQLDFPDNVIQQYGDVAIIYTTFRLITATSGVANPAYEGRATEMFRWDGKRWMHTGWHLSSKGS